LFSAWRLGVLWLLYGFLYMKCDFFLLLEMYVVLSFTFVYSLARASLVGCLWVTLIGLRAAHPLIPSLPTTSFFLLLLLLILPH
jgi:hypothetical protein